MKRRRFKDERTRRVAELAGELKVNFMVAMAADDEHDRRRAERDHSAAEQKVAADG